MFLFVIMALMSGGFRCWTTSRKMRAMKIMTVCIMKRRFSMAIVVGSVDLRRPHAVVLPDGAHTTQGAILIR